MKRILSSFGITAVTVGLMLVGFGCETYNEIDPKALKESSTVTTEKTLSQGDEPSESQKNMESKIDELMTKVNSQSSSANDAEIAALKEQIAALQETIEDLKANPPVKEEPPSSEPPDSSPPPSGDKADKAPPTIKEKSPTGSDVSVTSKKIVVTFNEKLADDAVTEESLSIDPPVTVKKVTDSNPTFTFALQKSLAQGKEYEVTLSKDGIKDVAGNELAKDKKWSFTTKQAEEAVAVVETTPVTGTVVPATPATPAAAKEPTITATRSGQCQLFEGDGDTDCEVESMGVTYRVDVANVTKVTVTCNGTLSRNDLSALSTPQATPQTRTNQVVQQDWTGEQDSVTLNCTFAIDGSPGTTTVAYASHCDDNTDCDACHDCDYLHYDIDGDGNQTACTGGHQDCE